jgi:allantoicase
MTADSAELAVPPEFTGLPDLASRRLGGTVVAANDELFAEKENLIKPAAPVFATGDYGPRGKVYDGWETRRRREPGHDYAIVRLGVPGIVHGVVADTAFFRGNYPPEVSVEALRVTGYPAVAELEALDWQPLVARSPAGGDAANYYPVASRKRWTHVRLSIYPDGGVARLRVHGEPVPDPAFLTGTIDLAALENGGRLVDCSDAFYSSAGNLIMPGLAVSMADGWENARRRDGGHDYATFALAAAGSVTRVELDTSFFVGNAPGWARLLGAQVPADAAEAQGEELQGEDLQRQEPQGREPQWRELLPRTRLQPDTRHRFLLAPSGPVTHVRLEVFPDGGMARLRLLGEITANGLARLREHYQACS